MHTQYVCNNLAESAACSDRMDAVTSLTNFFPFHRYQFSPASPLRQRDLVRPSIVSTEYANRYDHEPVR